MIPREALDKVRDEWSLAYSWYDPKEKKEGLNLIALDQYVGARKGFDAAVSLLWPVIEASERFVRLSLDEDANDDDWAQASMDTQDALSELKERVK